MEAMDKIFGSRWILDRVSVFYKIISAYDDDGEEE